jgi:hypothetical protein
VLGYLALLICSVTVAAARGQGEAGSIPGVVADAAVAVVGSGLPVAVFAVLAWAVATVTRSSASAVTLCLIVLFLEPLGVALLDVAGGPLSDATRFTLSRNIDALLAVNGSVAGSTVEVPDDLPAAWSAAVFLAGFCAAALAFGARSFNRREITE